MEAHWLLSYFLHLHKNPATQNSARRGQCNMKAFFEPEMLYKEKKYLLDIDQKWQYKWITCLKGSQAVGLSKPHVIHSWPFKNSFDVSWRHQHPGLSWPRGRWCPAQVQGLWLQVPAGWGLIIKNLKKEEKLQHFHKQPLSSCNATQ